MKSINRIHLPFLAALAVAAAWLAPSAAQSFPAQQAGIMSCCAAPAAEGRDYLVTVGKRAVLASSVRKVEARNARRAAQTTEPACCSNGNCCAHGSCCSVAGCCKVDKSCCLSNKDVCTDACGCKAANCCADKTPGKTPKTALCCKA